jgi:hypothetical protein
MKIRTDQPALQVLNQIKKAVLLKVKSLAIKNTRHLILNISRPDSRLVTTRSNGNAEVDVTLTKKPADVEAETEAGGKTLSNFTPSNPNQMQTNTHAGSFSNNRPADSNTSDAGGTVDKGSNVAQGSTTLSSDVSTTFKNSSSASNVEVGSNASNANQGSSKSSNSTDPTFFTNSSSASNLEKRSNANQDPTKLSSTADSQTFTNSSSASASIPNLKSPDTSKTTTAEIATTTTLAVTVINENHLSVEMENILSLG